MLSVVVKAIVECFAKYNWPEQIGCTGELDENGRLIAIGDLQEKLEIFFDIYPKGIVILPSENLPKLPKSLLHSRKEQLWGMGSIEEFFLHSRFKVNGHKLTEFWAKGISSLQDWRGEVLGKNSLLTVGLYEEDWYQYHKSEFLHSHENPYTKIFNCEKNTSRIYYKR